MVSSETRRCVSVSRARSRRIGTRSLAAESNSLSGGADAIRDVRPGAAASGELMRSIRATWRQPQLLLPIHAPRQCPAQTEMMGNQMSIPPGTLDRGREIACVRTHDIEKCAHRMSRLTRRVGLIASEKNALLD